MRTPGRIMDLQTGSDHRSRTTWMGQTSGIGRVTGQEPPGSGWSQGQRSLVRGQRPQNWVRSRIKDLQVRSGHGSRASELGQVTKSQTSGSESQGSHCSHEIKFKDFQELLTLIFKD